MLASQNQSPPVRVVVVEDDADDREILLRQLRKCHIDSHVRFIENGREALQFLSSLPIAAPYCDLIAIFLDLKLPGMSGVDLLREIRRTPRVLSTPVIIMTSSLNPQDFEACQSLKASAFIPKPITFDLFTKAITSLPVLASRKTGSLPRHYA